MSTQQTATRIAALVGALLLTLALPAIGGGTARAAAPECAAALFVATDGGDHVVEQPDSAPGAIFCAADGPLTFAVESGPVHGSLSALVANDSGGATFDYQPDAAYSGPDAFVLRVEDEEGAVVLVPLSVRVVAAGNDAPQCFATLSAPAAASGYRVEAGEPVQGRVTCVDDEDDPLTFQIAQQSVRGAVSGFVQDGDAAATFVYTPGQQLGDDAFALVADDGAGSSAPAVVEVEIVAAADAPPTCTVELATAIGPSGAFEVEQGSSVAAFVLCDDADSETLAFDVPLAPSHGALAPLTAAGPQAVETTYTPQPGYLGFDRFDVEADDGVNPPTPLSASIRVVPERDDPPRCTAIVQAPLVDGRHRVEQGETVSGRHDCDDESTALQHRAAEPPAHGTLSEFDADGRFDYTAATVFTGPDSFSLTASDGARESTPLAVPIEIVPAVDDPPECNVLLAAAPDAAGAYLVAGDRPVRGRIACTDDTPTAELTFALLSAPAHGTLSALTKESATSASFLYAPATGHRGADAFAFTIDDGVHGPRASGGTVRVVEPDTSAPRCSGRLHTPITADRYEVERGETVRGTISCLDLDGDELAFSVALLPTRGSLSALDTQRDSASFTYTAGADEGADRVELVAGDGTRSSNAVTLVIDVVEPYDAPPTCDIGLFTTPFASAAYPAQNRRPNPGIVSCVDDEGDPLEFTVAAPPQHGELAQFAPAHGFATFAYRAQGAYVGADAATVRVRDGAGGEETVTLMLDVHPSANGAPRCTVTLAAPLAGGVYELAAGVSADGQIACEDPDSDDLTIAIAEAPTRGALSVLAGGGSIREFSFSAGASAAGADRFVVRAVDALGAVTNVAVLLRIAAPATEPGERDPGPGDGGRGPGDGGPLPSPPLQPPGGSGAPGTPPETVPSRPPLPPSARALPPASLAGLRLAPMRKSRGLRLTFTAVPSQAIGVVVRTRLKRKLIVVGRATRRYARGGTQTLDVKLAPAGLRELKRRGSLALTVDITTRATGRAEARLTRKLLLRTSR